MKDLWKELVYSSILVMKLSKDYVFKYIYLADFIIV